MFYKYFNDKEIEILNRVEKETSNDYERTGNFIPAEKMMDIVEDLLDQIEVLKEKYEDLESDLQDNYRPIPQAEMYGISDKDFYVE